MLKDSGMKLERDIYYRNRDSAMRYTDGHGHLKLDSFAWPAVPLGYPPPQGEVNGYNRTPFGGKSFILFRLAVIWTIHWHLRQN